MPSPDPALLTKLAGTRAYQRGADYARAGAVEIVDISGSALSARAQGNHGYRVDLTWHDGRLQGQCDCPVGQRREFCKHQVAAALVWGAQATPDAAENGVHTRRPREKAEAAESVIAAWLRTRTAEQLRELLLSLADGRRDLQKELLARARFASRSPGDHRKAVSELIGRKRFLDYRASIEHARRLQALTALLRERLDSDPARALDLASHALQRLFPLYADSDDSSGAFGDVVRDVADLHRQAAASAAGVDAEDFARDWLKLKLADDCGLLAGVNGYAGILGSRGIAALERQVGEHIDALPPPPSTHRWQAASTATLVLLHLSEQIASHGGDVDAMLERRARVSLANAHDYLELHRLCREHGRDRVATQWLERGIKAFPDDIRLIDSLARIRAEEGFDAEALELAWRAFEHHSDESHYLALREHASCLRTWPHWRERALAHAYRTGNHVFGGGDGRVVRLHLAEHDIDAIVALLPEAKLPPDVWARLPEVLASDHPALALQACRTLVQAALERANKSGYRDAIAWLRRMPTLHRRLGDEAGFGDYLDALRTRHRAKRSFIAMLDADGSTVPRP